MYLNKRQIIKVLTFLTIVRYQSKANHCFSIPAFEFRNIIQVQKDINFNQVMIEKSRVYPEFQYPPQKFHIDHFHNPYLAKLSLKLSPRPFSDASYKFISPLSGDNNLYAAQSIPIYKNQKIRIALLWRQYLTQKFARAHFGVSVQYKIYEQLKVKTRLMAGTTSLLDVQTSKYFKNGVETFFGYSGFAEANNIFSTFSVGIRKAGFSALLTKKMDFQTQWKIGFSRQVSRGIYFEAIGNGKVDSPERGQVQLNLNQILSEKNQASMGVFFCPYYEQVGLKVQYERKITRNQKLLISSQFSDGKTTMYIGFKNLNFNLVLPFFVVDSPIPVIFGALAFVCGYLYRQFAQSDNLIQEKKFEGKSFADRLQELNVISDKAADHYQKQKNNEQGLLIEQVYIGPNGDVEQFMADPNRHVLLIRSEEHKRKFIDLTVTFRFYVMKGQLKLRKGDKSGLLGFFRRQANHTRIGIRFSRGGISQTIFFDHLDPIILVPPK